MTGVPTDRSFRRRREYARLNRQAWGLGVGLTGCALLGLATLALVLEGGDPVGPHLALLGAYLPGYRVTAVGAGVGAAYGFAVGYLFGRALASLYNRFSRAG